ncbi:aminotransferase class I/II-fold pyridoxal phosphate-dependent enzyme [Pseudonocardia sp. TRM90224]|uniref:aminotransferase class I/II-fold pyridoxal phosphate-dependent enzyme n=1 Tax=Pseudonocardia sp. TRM90224 TaxID=2812678 RepID=UPI001E588319|nr:aminotransferase class I/II-fold pyridoxal phosphate-dependent enzyme [Pseudonocardia sp. TRM90224]
MTDDVSTADLSMNESPYCPVPAVLDAVRSAAARMQRYPDFRAADVGTALAKHLDVPEGELVLGPGSAGLTQLVIQALDPGRSEVVHPALSFEGYPLMIANARTRSVPVPLAGLAHDLDAMAAAVTERTRCVLLCNPNNPTAAALTQAEVTEFLARIPAEVVVVIDEAYRDYVSDPGCADPGWADGLALRGAHDNVCVVRTFSKAHGLAALRIGYAVVPARIATSVRMASILFYPGGLAQAAAIACLEPDVQETAARRAAELRDTRDRLRADLVAAGLPVAPSETNFLWLPLGPDSEGFTARCAAAGILVRCFPGVGVRLTVGSAADNARVLAVAGSR